MTQAAAKVLGAGISALGKLAVRNAKNIAAVPEVTAALKAGGRVENIRRASGGVISEVLVKMPDGSVSKIPVSLGKGRAFVPDAEQASGVRLLSQGGIRPSTVARYTAQEAIDKPEAATLGAAAMGLGLLGIVRDKVALAEQNGQQLKNLTDRERLLAEYVKLRSARADRERQDKSAALAFLAERRPDLYMQLAAGRRLPRGVVTVGGTPNNDLLQMVAERMIAGQMNATQKTDPQGQLISASFQPARSAQ